MSNKNKMSLIQYLKTFIKNFFLKNSIFIGRYRYSKVDELLKKIKIIDSGHELVRVGREGDGGYLVPNILSSIEYSFSPGVGNSISFDNDLKKYNIKSFLLDGTIDSIEDFDFIKKNINSYNDKNNITLDKFLDLKLQSKSNNKLILQMDVEGAEIEMLYSTSIETLCRFKIIIIEFHHFFEIITPMGLKVYNDIFDKLLINHRIVHIHPNNQDGITLNINNYKISNGYNFTFINKKDCKFMKKINYELPHKLDFRSNANLPEVKIPEIFYK